MSILPSPAPPDPGPEMTTGEYRANAFREEIHILVWAKRILVAAASVLAVCAVAGSFAVFVWGKSEKQTEQQIDSRVVPVEKRLTFVEGVVPFIAAETREIRIEQRALALESRTGESSRTLLTRAMAPLPALQAPDSGSP